MFTLTDTPGKFVILLVLLAGCVVWETVQLTRRPTGARLVSCLLHWFMAVVMFLMVPRTLWQPFHDLLPLPVLIAIFGVGVVWFVIQAVRAADRHGRLHSIGHAAMFGAMTWHLAGMQVMMSVMGGHGHDHGAHQHTDHSGHGDMHGHGHGDMPGHGDMADPSAVGGPLWIVAVIGLPFMIYLLVAALVELRRAVRGAGPDHDAPATERVAEPVGVGAAGATTAVAEPAVQHRPESAVAGRLAALSMFAMNFSMWFMSTGLMVPLLGFMTIFAF